MLSAERPGYRHELKYLISAAQIEILKTRIHGIMMPDPHKRKDGKYTVRSVRVKYSSVF